MECDLKANGGLRSRMSLCPECGDKRCPRAEDHRAECSSQGKQTQQEPIAYLYHDASAARHANPRIHSTLLVLACDRQPQCRNETPLYDHPQQKESRKSFEWIELYKKADAFTKSKYVYQKFIDGTPLENDIACWMADFVIDQLNEITE